MSKRQVWSIHNALLCSWLAAMQLVTLAQGTEVNEYKLGLLFPFSPAAWALESIAQFKFAVQEVNSDPNILNGITLNYIARDTKAEEMVALKGAIELLEQGVVGIVGAGYSYAIPLPAGYSSFKMKPIIGPSSVMVELTDKSSYPYLLRTSPGIGLSLRLCVVVAWDLGFREVAGLIVKEYSDIFTQVISPALESLGMGHSIFFLDNAFDSPAAQRATAELQVQKVMEVVALSGYRVVLGLTMFDNAEPLSRIAQKAGLRSAKHTWILLTQALAINGWASGSDASLWIQPINGGENQVYDAYAERWAHATTRYDPKVHGVYDDITGEPFFGNSTFSSLIWDTSYDMELGGDRLIDGWSMYAYDTVWLYARAIQAMLDAGQDPMDGALLRNELLGQTFSGVTGNVFFDQESQDRVEEVEVVLLHDNSSEPYFLAGIKPKLLETSTSDDDWCRTGCTTVGDIDLAAVPWPAGELPRDGRGLDHTHSSFIIASSYAEESPIEVIVTVRDAFKKAPCALRCENSTSTGCATCLNEVNLDFLALHPRFQEKASGNILTPTVPVVLNIDKATGVLSLLLPEGLQGSGSEDRTVLLDVFYDGDALSGGGQEILLRSTDWDDAKPCELGYYSPRGVSPCSTCSFGTFQDELGATECKACPAGYIATQQGMSECRPCNQGDYQNETGQWACDSCTDVLGDGSTTMIVGASSADYCLCKEEYFFLASESQRYGSCRPCIEGLVCPGAFDAPLQAEGFHVGELTDGRPEFVILCANQHVCPGGTNLSTCPLHRTGLGCDKCEADYTDEGEGKCAECTDSGGLMRIIIAILLGLAVLFALYKFSSQKTSTRNENIISVSVIVSLTIMAFQSFGAITGLEVDWPGMVKGAGVIVDFASLRIDSVLHLSCILRSNDPLASYVFSLLVYPTGLLAILGSFAVARLLGRPVERFHVVSAIATAMLAYYLPVGRAASLPLQCSENPDGSSSVHAFRSVLCSSHDHVIMAIFAVSMILTYVLPLFVLVLYLTIVYPRRLAQNDRIFLRQSEFLFKRFKTDYYFHGIIFMLRSLSMALIPVIFQGSPELQVMAMLMTIVSALCLTCYHCPWRTNAANAFDILILWSFVCWVAPGFFLTDFDLDRVRVIVKVVSMVSLACMCCFATSFIMLAGKRWLRPVKYGVLISSHEKGAAQVLARWFKVKLNEHLIDKIFLDCDHLMEYSRLHHIVGYETKNVVVLLTQQTLYDTRCASEIVIAYTQKVNIVVVSCDGTKSPSDEFLAELDGLWTDAQRCEFAKRGVDIARISEAYRSLRDAPLLELSLDCGVYAQIIDPLLEKLQGCSKREAPEDKVAQYKVADDEFPRPADLLVLGNMEDREALCCCQVVKRMLALETKLLTAVLGEEPAMMAAQVNGCKVLIAVLSTGVLHCAQFAAAIVKAVSHEEKLAIIPLIADVGFVCPNAAFWAELQEGKVLKSTAPALKGISLAEVEEAYKALFSVAVAGIPQKFTEQSCEEVQRHEIKTLAGRISRDRLFNSSSQPDVPQK